MRENRDVEDYELVHVPADHPYKIDPLKTQSRHYLFTLALVVSVVCNFALLGTTLILNRQLHAANQHLMSPGFVSSHITAISTSDPVMLEKAVNARQLQVTDVVPADVTVTVDGMTYHGNDKHAAGGVRKNEEGCMVYEQFRQDGKEGRVTCCGEGDCLLGFLTEHQWLFSWLRR